MIFKGEEDNRLVADVSPDAQNDHRWESERWIVEPSDSIHSEQADEVIEQVCNDIEDVVVPANYNTNGQLVISGSIAGIDKACAKLTEMVVMIIIELH